MGGHAQDRFFWKTTGVFAGKQDSTVPVSNMKLFCNKLRNIM